MDAGLPNRSRSNKQGYQGDSIPVDDLLMRLVNESAHCGWVSESLPLEKNDSLLFLHRDSDTQLPKIFISAGIHGDEPATTSAICDLIQSDLLPKTFSYFIFPCMNPRGMRLSIRETPEGKDLNRDYLGEETGEVQTQLRKIKSVDQFELALLLHEDWESSGFYLYELTKPDTPPRFGPKVLDAVSKICPIETSAQIDGLEASKGLIHPPYHLNQRTDWPEAFYLMRHKTNHSLTLESPSDFDMQVRIDALKTSVLTAVEMLVK